ncbi:MAG: beta strand repeat-containing protein, partial [Saprospiraceae bacterium]
MKFKLHYFLMSFLILSGTSVFAQLSGTISVPGTYPTLAAAITALNSSGVNAPVTIEVSAGETAPTGGFVVNTFVGSSAVNTVTIKAIGTITLTAQVGTSTTVDGIFKFNGADNITLDGFTIEENTANITATTQMEWGIAILSASSSNSSQNIKIKNCSVNLNGVTNTTNEIGIYAAHHGISATTAMTPTAVGGAYTGLEITGCTINNAYTGISIGLSGSASFFDGNITVGTLGAGNTITNFGGGAIQAYGIRLEFASNANINYNIVDNTAISTHTLTLDGIYNANGTAQNLTVTNNLVKVRRGSSTSQVCAIRNIGYTGAVTWNNNEITGCVAEGSSGVYYLMYNTAAANSLTVNNNNIHDNIGLNTTGTTSMFYNIGAVPSLTFSGNSLSNNSKITATTGTIYGYWNTGTAANGTETITNNTLNGQGISGYAAINYGIYSSTALTQTRIASGNNISGLISSSTIYALYCLSGNTSTLSNNKVSNITQTGTGIVYTVYSSGNRAVISGNKISNLSFPGTGGTLYGIFGAGTVSNQINNDTLTNITGNLVTTYAIYCSGSSTSGQINNNIVEDITGVNTFGGLYLLGTKINAYNNSIKNITGSTSATTAIMYGTYISNSASDYNIYNNTFDNFINKATTTGSMFAFHTASALTVNAYKNSFTNFSNTSGTTNRLNCFNLVGAGSTVTAYNNVFSGFSGGTSTDGAALNAILASPASGTFNFYNNTFRLSGNLTSGGASGVFFSGTSATINCINNIFDINVTAVDLTRSVSLMRKATAAGAFNYAATSNNNVNFAPDNTNSFFYIEGLNTTTPFSGGISMNVMPISGITDPGFNTACSITKALLGGRDGNSFYEQITFVGNVPSGATFAESGGQTIALVTDDITNATRTSPPDCGAYEFSGVASTADVAGPIITYSNIPNSICTNSVPISVNITDASGIKIIPGQKPRIWFRKSTEQDTLPSVNSSLEAGWKYVEATNSSSPFLFNVDLTLLNSPAIATDVIRYFVIASDNAGNVSANQVGFKNGYCAATVALDVAAFPTTGVPATRTFTIISPPSSVTVLASKATICGSDVTVLSLTGDPATGAEYQWQSSPSVAGVYTDIPGATSFTYSASITSTADLN